MLAAILHALRRATQRDLGTFAALRVNNFFLFVALLVAGAVSSGVQPWSAYPFLGLLGILLAFPLSGDPLDRIPVERQLLWPLTRSQSLALRCIGRLLNPILWLALLLLPRIGWSGAGVLLGFQFLTIGIRSIVRQLPNLDIARAVPLFPGTMGALVTNHLRQMLALLDTWLAVALAVGAWTYRLRGPIGDTQGPPILGIVIALALSTQAQSLFSLDGTGGKSLPVRGWQRLLAKDIAFLGVLLLLALPLNPLPAMASGLAALSVGHHSSVLIPMAQKRWRFTGGRLLPIGALQAVATVAAGFAQIRSSVFVIAVLTVLFVASLSVYGRLLDRFNR